MTAKLEIPPWMIKAVKEILYTTDYEKVVPTAAGQKHIEYLAAIIAAHAPEPEPSTEIPSEVLRVWLLNAVVDNEVQANHLWGLTQAAATGAFNAVHVPEPVAHSKSQHKRLVAQGAIGPSVPVSELEEFKSQCVNVVRESGIAKPIYAAAYSEFASALTTLIHTALIHGVESKEKP